jgi:dephospho-CoA kinase
MTVDWDIIDIEVPRELLGCKSEEVDFSLLENKTVIGLMGYSKSGKDTVGSVLSKKYNFQRVAFGDVMKTDMNNYLRSTIKSDLDKKGVKIDVDDMDFINPKTQEIKEILRPYMIWFGQEMRKLNGQHYWTNRALSQLKLSSIRTNKIVITDIRRECELDIFTKKSANRMLIHINQYGLSDSDELTMTTIRKAHELWLIDHTIFVDSRVPIANRPEHIWSHVDNLKIKFSEYFN